VKDRVRLTVGNRARWRDESERIRKLAQDIGGERMNGRATDPTSIAQERTVERIADARSDFGCGFPRERYDNDLIRFDLFGFDEIEGT